MAVQFTSADFWEVHNQIYTFLGFIYLLSNVVFILFSCTNWCHLLLHAWLRKDWGIDLLTIIGSLGILQQTWLLQYAKGDNFLSVWFQLSNLDKGFTWLKILPFNIFQYIYANAQSTFTIFCNSVVWELLTLLVFPQLLSLHLNIVCTMSYSCSCMSSQTWMHLGYRAVLAICYDSTFEDCKLLSWHKSQLLISLAFSVLGTYNYTCMYWNQNYYSVYLLV